MELLEYLEKVTAAMASNARARVIRQEIAAHFVHLKEDLLKDGHDPAEAEKLAFERLGNPEALSREIARGEGTSRRRFGLEALAVVPSILGAVLAPTHAWALLLVAAGGVTGSILRDGLAPWKRPLRSFAAALRQHPWMTGMTAVLGVLIGSWPLYAAGRYDPWHLPGPLVWAAPVMALVAVGTALRRVLSDGRGPWIPAHLGGSVLVLTSALSGLLLWRMYPVPPSPYVDWFVLASPSQPWTQGLTQIAARPIFFGAIWFVGILGLGAAVGALRSSWEALRPTVPGKARA